MRVFCAFLMFAWKFARKVRGAPHGFGLGFFFVVKTKGCQSLKLRGARTLCQWFFLVFWRIRSAAQFLTDISNLFYFTKSASKKFFLSRTKYVYYETMCKRPGRKPTIWTLSKPQNPFQKWSSYKLIFRHSKVTCQNLRIRPKIKIFDDILMILDNILMIFWCYNHKNLLENM